MICQDFNLSRSFFPCCLGFSISHQKKNFAKQKTTGTRKLKSQVVKGINLGGRGDTSPSPPSSLHTCPLVSFLKCVQRERRIWDFRGRCRRMREQDETEGFARKITLACVFESAVCLSVITLIFTEVGKLLFISE